jgi:hypothetical protein
MLNLKLLSILLFISTTISFRTLYIDSKIIPNLLSNPDQVKAKILNELRKEANKYRFSFPTGTSSLITDLASTTQIKMDKITYNQIDSLKNTHNFPIDVISKFKKLKYLKNNVVYDSFTFSKKRSKTSTEIVFGIGARLDETYLYVTYVKGLSSGKEIPQYKQVKYRQCKRFLFIKNCKNKYKKVRRGLTDSELIKIKEALKAKYGQMLNSVLDLDQQKMLNKFKMYSREIQRQYPITNYNRQYIVNSFTNLDFRTSKVNYQDVKKVFGKIFPQDICNGIISYSNKKGQTYQFFKISDTKEIKEINFLIGIAYNINNQFLISYAKGKGTANLYHGYCFYQNGKEYKNIDCLFDEDCMKDCKEYSKKYQSIIKNPLKFNNLNDLKNFIFSIKKSIYAELAKNLVKILDGIQF